MITFRYRIKDSSCKKKLRLLASKVNFVWNYCNETSLKAWKRDRKWLSEFEMNHLLAGGPKEIGLTSAIMQQISRVHAKNRNQYKKCKLSWRSDKRSLGWIPLDLRCFTIKGDVIKFNKLSFRIWKHRELEGEIKTASVTQNAKGQWFVNIVCEVPTVDAPKTNKTIGVDLGLKTVATCSDGTVYQHPKATALYAAKLAKAQRAKKKRLVTNLHNKIANVRKDFLHKTSRKIVDSADTIFVGDVSSNAMIRRGKEFAKSALDASWGQLRTMLAYKASRLGKVFQPVREAWSTVTCSTCSKQTGPNGLSALGVRSWVCDCCGTEHSRDVNAAINIRNFGVGLYPLEQEAPSEGSSHGF